MASSIIALPKSLQHRAAYGLVTFRKITVPVQVVAKSNSPVLDQEEFRTPKKQPDSQIGSSKPLRSPSWIEEQLEAEELESTVQHRLWVGAASFLLLGLFARGIAEGDNVGYGVLAGAGGYATIDLLSGIYHWAIDNYGSPSTPFVGKQIEGFQGHHVHPWTITHRQFCNNVHTICKPAIPITLLVLAIHPPFYVDTYMSVGTAGAILSQQFHAWAHTKKSELPSAVKFLQDMGVLVSTVEHCRHHMQPFNSDYCIIGGFWNKLLDTSGLFKSWENIIYDRTGVKPRCWNEGGVPDVTYYGD